MRRSCLRLTNQNLKFRFPNRQRLIQRKFGKYTQFSVALDGGSSTVQCDEEAHMLPWRTGGGYIPMNLGATLGFHGEYEVIRKLGWGSHGSAWMARRKDDGQYVALKVLTRLVTVATGFHENEAMKRISESKTPGASFCTISIGTFASNSDHGEHRVFVFQLYAMTLEDIQRRERGQAKQTSFTVTLPVVKHIMQQLFLALSSLHSVGMIHTDIIMSNVFVHYQGTNVHDRVSEYIAKHPAETYPPKRFPSILYPDPVVTPRSQPLDGIGIENLQSIRIALGDFGGAIPVEHAHRIQMPGGTEAPEISLHHPLFGTPTDIWAVGCMILELFTSKIIFLQSAVPGMTPEETHLARIVELLGHPFPASFLAKCKDRDLFFDDDGQLKKPLPPTAERTGTIKERLRNAGFTSETDIADMDRFMRRCLTIDPTSRPSSDELLTDEWFKGVPLPTVAPATTINAAVK